MSIKVQILSWFFGILTISAILGEVLSSYMAYNLAMFLSEGLAIVFMIWIYDMKEKLNNFQNKKEDI